MDTKYADVSEFQPNVGDAYPYQFIAIRSNDGTYQDHHFAANLAWCKQACDSGRLAGFIVYFVWEIDWHAAASTFFRMVGDPHPRMAVMIDVESWNGKITGDHSHGINACARSVENWLVSHGVSKDAAHKRVVGYANAGDFATIWPRRGDRSVVLANYSSNPDFPGKIAHQYANNEPTPPFGPCDINSADGLTPQQFAAALGLDDAAPRKHRKPKPKPDPHPRAHHWHWLALHRGRALARLRKLIARLRGKK